MIRVFRQYVSVKTLLLVMLEAMMIGVAVLCAARVRFWDDPVEFQSYIGSPGFLWQCVAVVTIFQVCFYYSDLYGPRTFSGRTAQLVCVGQALGAGCLILGLLYAIFPDLLMGRGVLMLSLSFVAALVILNRIGLDSVWEAAAPRERVLILGTRDLALRVAREFARRDDLNTFVVGFIDLGSGTGIHRDKIMGCPVFEATAGLENIVAAQEIDKLIVALEDRRGALPIKDLVKLKVQGIRVEDAHTTMAALSGRVWLNTVKPSWFVFTDGFHRSKTTLILKRMIDLTCAFLGLLVTLPIMAAVAIAIRLDSKGPIIYRQQRVGWRRKHFEVMKFRSMTNEAEVNGAQWAQEADPRVTRVGKILRKYRLDELPQFVNVIRGDMSFVGPRPERPFFVDQLREHISYYDERHSVRPGLTGWAQVQYRYGASVEDTYRKLEYDLFYLQNMSIFFDCAIILKTIRTVLGGQGAEPTKREYEEVSETIDDCGSRNAGNLAFQLCAVAGGQAGPVSGIRQESNGEEGLPPRRPGIQERVEG
jgi:sugar transferase (PEP-CTERM system associated)